MCPISIECLNTEALMKDKRNSPYPASEKKQTCRKGLNCRVKAWALQLQIWRLKFCFNHIYRAPTIYWVYLYPNKYIKSLMSSQELNTIITPIFQVRNLELEARAAHHGPRANVLTFQLPGCLPGLSFQARELSVNVSLCICLSCMQSKEERPSQGMSPLGTRSHGARRKFWS